MAEHEPGVKPDVVSEQAALLQAQAVCGCAIVGIHFSGDRVSYISFEDELSLSISADHSLGDDDKAWELAVQANGTWESIVWIRQGGDLICGDSV